MGWPDELWHEDLRLVFDDQYEMSHYVDASEPTASNYLRYLRPAPRDDQEAQNCFMYQWRGEVYYVTCEFVPAGQELLAW